MLRCAVADGTLVRRICLCCRNLVAIVVVDEQQAVLVDASMLIAIELANLSTLLDTEEVLAGTRTWLLIQVEVCHLICIAR